MSIAVKEVMLSRHEAGPSDAVSSVG